MVRKTKCIELVKEYTEFVPSQQNPDEGCINCILDDILETEEGELRDAWIELYKKGLMRLNCAKTGKSYMINKDFFESIFRQF